MMNTMHSELLIEGIFSEEDTDYRVLDESLRITEDNVPRGTEDNELRTLENEP